MALTLSLGRRGKLSRGNFALSYRLNYQKCLRRQAVRLLHQKRVIVIRDDNDVEYGRVEEKEKKERAALPSCAWSVSRIVWVSVVVYCVLLVRQDLNRELAYQTEKNQVIYQQCLLDYEKNRCDVSTRVKALEKFCREKEFCLKEQRQSQQNTVLMTSLLKDILNEFFAGLELKTVLVMSILLVVAPMPSCLRG